MNIYMGRSNHMKALGLMWIWATLAAAVFPKLSSSLFGQVSWTLDDVIQMAEDQSIFRYQADANNEIARSQWKFFKTNFNPIATLRVLAPNYSKTSRETIQPDGTIAFQSVSQNNSSINLGVEQQIKVTGGTVFFNSQLQRFDDFSSDFKLYNGIPFRVGLNQPLFGFNELKWSSQIEPLALMEADRQYVINMEDIHLQGTIVFFDLLSAIMDQQIAKSNSEVNNTLLEIAKERYTLGKISRSDLLQLELEYKGAIKDVSTTTFQVEFAESALLTFLGGTQADDVNLVTPDPRSDEIVIQSAIALSHARENRPEIVSFERQKLEADRDIRSASVQYGLQANLFASYGFARGSEQLSDIYSDPISEQQVQLSLSIPILDWGRKKSAVGIARAQKELIYKHWGTGSNYNRKYNFKKKLEKYHLKDSKFLARDMS